MFQRLQGLANRTLRSFGYEIRQFDGGNPFFQERKALMDPRIDTIVDVGANEGQYGRRIRKLNQKVKIFSFEPLPDAFSILEYSVKRDDNWNAFNCGIGSKSCTMELIVSENTQCSSFLSVSDICTDVVSSSKSKGRIEVPVEKLDSFRSRFGRGLYLKIDTQGFEMEVIEGAIETIRDSLYVCIEVSFVELYSGSPLSHHVIQKMHDIGFGVISVSPGFSDIESARMLQADVLFAKFE